MRRIAIAAFAALFVTACSKDSTGPATPNLTIGAGAFGTALTIAGGYDADTYQNRLANGLPDEIRLTSDQQARIKALVQAFEQATRSDREALGAILREARSAIEAKKSRNQVNAILSRGADIRARLAAAESKLKSDIDAVLTPEQRAWVAAHSPRACKAEQFPPLTDAQKAQIRSLESAFQEKNKADLETMKAAMDEAQVAIRAGKSRDEVAAIMAKAAPAAARLAAARKTLHDQILAVLTPEQKASGCVPLG
ncbi:MAG: Spy/CpxP family protein refolding chaperone [Gemmatimonadaceae bacterium]|nr:Spy/CpxP family protein refolding chaperone [Gemmatimonadaceae bacterium]